jgi:hypothetical protein
LTVIAARARFVESLDFANITRWRAPRADIVNDSTAKLVGSYSKYAYQRETRLALDQVEGLAIWWINTPERVNEDRRTSPRRRRDLSDFTEFAVRFYPQASSGCREMLAWAHPQAPELKGINSTEVSSTPMDQLP